VRYAQVVKSDRRRRVIRVRPRVVVGTLARVNWVLEALGWQINTAFMARANRAMRHHVAALGRRVMTVCPGEVGLRQQRARYQTDDHWCWPHTSVSLLLPQPLPTNGSGSAQWWQPRTPAMAAGLTDHVWTLRGGAAVPRATMAPAARVVSCWEA
jgi:hypothetical protein